MKQVYNEKGFESENEIGKKNPFDVFLRENRMPSTGDFFEERNEITPQTHIRKELIRLALTRRNCRKHLMCKATELILQQNT